MDPTTSPTTTNKEAPPSQQQQPRLAPSALEVERLRMQMTMNKLSGASPSLSTQGISSSTHGTQDTVGEIPSMSIGNQRGVRRLKSSSPNMSSLSRNASGNVSAMVAAPTKSTDAAASIRGSAVARANSSRNLLQRATSSSNSTTNSAAPLTRNGIPVVGRNTSSQGLRAYDKNQVMNTSIRGKSSNTQSDGILNMHIRGPGGTLGLQRNESEMSLGEFSISDGSLFTTDSVFVRKSQFIADPIHIGGDNYDDDDTYHTYNGDDSFADHESFMTRDSDVHNHHPPSRVYEVPPVLNPSTTIIPSSSSSSNATSNNSNTIIPSDHPRTTVNTLKALSTIPNQHSSTNGNTNGSQTRRQLLQHQHSHDDISLISYNTIASGLTHTEFTEHTEHCYPNDYYSINEEEYDE